MALSDRKGIGVSSLPSLPMSRIFPPLRSSNYHYPLNLFSSLTFSPPHSLNRIQSDGSIHSQGVAIPSSHFPHYHALLTQRKRWLSAHLVVRKNFNRRMKKSKDQCERRSHTKGRSKEGKHSHQRFSSTELHHSKSNNGQYRNTKRPEQSERTS